jgi:catechol 2,3-dioxygenase-like lactoylglutathione lyase family enzyme
VGDVPATSKLRSLDHVALWVADRDTIADRCTRWLGMHVIERTDRFTLIGADALRGKLTLFTAEGPREQGALEHVGLRVSSLDRTQQALPPGLTEELRAGEATFELAEGLRIGLVEAKTETEYDLDHVALRCADPERAVAGWRALGFEEAPARDGVTRVEAGGAFVELRPAAPAAAERPLLNHLAVLVDSADAWRTRAEDAGAEVADVVDAPNTYAVFVWGPEGVKLEYVEHKPAFSLR